MTHEVVVVGGGIGGLTVAALLAARGVDVCLLERQSRVGGCVAAFEKFGYTFDPGVGLYPLWEAGEIHDQIFSELPVERPEVLSDDPAYVVRLPDQTDFSITSDTEQFETSLLTSFPECCERAIAFYQESAKASADLLRMDRNTNSQTETVLDHLEGTSFRFRRFIDVQLRLLVQASLDECDYRYGSFALNILRKGNFSIRGGAPALADKLAESIRTSGGRVRLDTTALRLAYDSSGNAIGVDLLTGERLMASRAIVSNLTVWDTFGKLVGLNRTPSELRKRLNSLRTLGVYLLYFGISEAAASKLPNNRILALTDWPHDIDHNPEEFQFMFASSPRHDARAPEAMRAVTMLTFSDVDEWFSFQETEEENEERDQSHMELWWTRLHKALPEIGDAIEVIDTSTPRTVYDLTRRKLGMVGGFGGTARASNSNVINQQTHLPNLFRIGDTASLGAGLAPVSCSALLLANHLTGRS